jgi:hypothetical protein
VGLGVLCNGIQNAIRPERLPREILGNHRDNLGKAGWSWGCVAAVDLSGRTIWIADTHRDGKRFVAHADKKLTESVSSKDLCANAMLF